MGTVPAAAARLSRRAGNPGYDCVVALADVRYVAPHVRHDARALVSHHGGPLGIGPVQLMQLRVADAARHELHDDLVRLRVRDLYVIDDEWFTMCNIDCSSALHESSIVQIGLADASPPKL